MGNIFTKKGLLFGLLLVVFIIIFELIIARLSLPAWPAFMVMIFFFVAHEDIKQAPNILIGGLTGISCVMLSSVFVEIFQPVIGHEASKLTFIGLFVYAIVLMKDTLPYVFNAFAFMFFLVSAIALPSSNVSPLIWMGVELVFGGVFILGILGINRLVNLILREN
jgi:hypothetical protein